MNAMRAVIATAILFCLVPDVPAQDVPASLTKEKLIGKWRSGDTNGLNCLAIFTATNASFHMFNGTRQGFSIQSWYHLFDSGSKVSLGLSGEADVLAGDKLHLKLRPPHIPPGVTILSNVVVTRLP